LDPDNEDQLVGWIDQEGDQALVVWPEVQHPHRPVSPLIGTALYSAGSAITTASRKRASSARAGWLSAANSCSAGPSSSHRYTLRHRIGPGSPAGSPAPPRAVAHLADSR
jgi:hypothetical protein